MKSGKEKQNFQEVNLSKVELDLRVLEPRGTYKLKA